MAKITKTALPPVALAAKAASLSVIDACVAFEHFVLLSSVSPSTPGPPTAFRRPKNAVWLRYLARSGSPAPCCSIELRQAGADGFGHVGLARDLPQEIGIVRHSERIERDGLENRRERRGCARRHALWPGEIARTVEWQPRAQVDSGRLNLVQRQRPDDWLRRIKRGPGGFLRNRLWLFQFLGKLGQIAKGGACRARRAALSDTLATSGSPVACSRNSWRLLPPTLIASPFAPSASIKSGDSVARDAVDHDQSD